MGVEFHWSLANDGDCPLCHRGAHTRLGVGGSGDCSRGVVGPVVYRTGASEAPALPRALSLPR